MTNISKVAVITRTKDRPIFLKRAIRSVASQNYRDFVHVIINDGGDKSSVESAVSSYDSETTDKIRLFHREESSNAPDTIFNESIDRVDSKYFAVHDDDDTWHIDFLAETVSHLESNDSIAAVVVRTDRIDEEVKEDDSVVTTRTSHWMPDLKVVNLYRQCIDNQLTPIATLFRRSAYQDVGKFDESLPVVGDWEFGVRLLSRYDVDFIDKGFALAKYHHRKHKVGVQGNTSFAGNDMHRYYTNLIMNRYLRQELTEGRMGIGYIMSKLRYDQHEKAVMVERVLPKFITARLKSRIQN